MATFGFDIQLIVADGKENSYSKGVSIIDLGLPSSRISRMLLYPFKILKCISRDRILHIHDPELLPIAFTLSLFGYRVIYDAHEDLPRQILSKPWIPPYQRKFCSVIVERIENFLAKKMHAVICATEEIALRFSLLGIPLATVQNTPILSEFIAHEKNKTISKTICYVGGISRARGILELVNALELAPPQVKLILAGTFQEDGLLEEVTRLTGWQQVDYRGHVGRTEIASILNNSDIGIVTLLPIPNYLESMPVKMFEYMASSLPVLASNFPLWISIVEDNDAGRCVDPTSPTEIANAIRSMLDSPDSLKIMSSNALELVRSKYHWGNDSTTLNNFYQSVFNNQSDSNPPEK